MGGADIAVTAISSATAIALAFIAKQNRDIRTVATHNRKQVSEVKETLGKVERQTNGQLKEKIREAVRDELLKHPTDAQEMRDLLDAVLYGITREGEDNGGQ